MTTILMIRHGESRANRSGYFAGVTDAELEENGLNQAKRTARYIADGYNVDKVYASDLKRAYNTGKCLADLLNIEIVSDTNLREIYGGQWEGVKYDELHIKFARDHHLWLKDIGNVRCTGGESVKELSERVMKKLTEIACENDGKTVAVATHATPIRAMQTLVEYGDLDKMKDVPWVSNASVTIFEYDNGKWKCVQASYDEHLKDVKTVLPKNC